MRGGRWWAASFSSTVASHRAAAHMDVAIGDNATKLRLVREGLTINPAIPVDMTIIEANGFENGERNKLLKVERVVGHPEVDKTAVQIRLSFALALMEQGIPQVHVRRDRSRKNCRVVLINIEAVGLQQL